MQNQGFLTCLNFQFGLLTLGMERLYGKLLIIKKEW